MPYFLIGTKIIYLHTAMFLYNTGINVFLLVFTASFNTKRVDLMTKVHSITKELPIKVSNNSSNHVYSNTLSRSAKYFTTYNVIMLIFGVLACSECCFYPFK